jgi:zinc protease
MMICSSSLPRLFAAWLLMFVLGAAASASQALEIQQVRSKKGITAWLVEDHTVPVIAMNYAFKGGGAADPKGKFGLAHFLSAMLDEGAGDMDSGLSGAHGRTGFLHEPFRGARLVHRQLQDIDAQP